MPAAPRYACSGFAARPGQLEELPLRGKLILRGDPADKKFSDAVARVTGGSLPAANSVARTGKHTVYWLGPDEWQITGELPCARLEQTLREALSGLHYSCVDVSDYYATLRLSGEAAHEWLARGCPLDLHPRAFAAGGVAQTRFGHASILLHKVEPQAFELQVRWSFAEYLWRYLTTVIDNSGA